MAASVVWLITSGRSRRLPLCWTDCGSSVGRTLGFMRAPGAELVLVFAVCIAGTIGIFVWRTHPVIATALIAAVSLVAGWVGYRVETVLHPERGRLRRYVMMPAIYAALAVLGAALVWGLYCPCSSN
jgi:hypothetical protein